MASGTGRCEAGGRRPALAVRWLLVLQLVCHGAPRQNTLKQELELELELELNYKLWPGLILRCCQSPMATALPQSTGATATILTL